MKNLVLITNNFPQKGKETFLVEELPFLARGFKKVYIFTLKPSGNYIELPNNVQVLPILSNPISKKEKLGFCLSGLAGISNALRLEKKSNGLSLLLKYGAQSNKLKSVLAANKLDEKNTLFYTYWLDEGAVILALLKEKIKGLKIISRAHGYDLYEEDYANGLPYFYSYALTHLHSIYFISENGKEYFSKKHNVKIDLEISKLGTMDFGIGPQSGADLVIATCSSIIPLKRLDLLAKALTKLKGKKVIWHHHGDGPLRQEVFELVSNVPTVEANFHGQVGNKELMEFYKNTYISLFVNVSRTEGLPVSLVEASSFGIPLLATNVRGTKEVCTPQTGTLLDSDINAEDLALQIEKAVNKDWNRIEIREFWKSHFYGENNFEEFAKTIAAL